MTRREEIKQKALSKYPQGTNRYNKFIEGAKWADKTMIEKVEKACEWVEDNVENVFVCVNGIMTELNGIELSKCIRKAMEE